MNRSMGGALFVLACAASGCGSAADQSLEPPSGNPSGGDAATTTNDAGAPGVDAGTTTNDAGTTSDSASPIDGSPGSPCYSETYDPHANLADLKMAYTQSAWLTSSLEAMKRRYSTGHFVLDAERNDGQLYSFSDPSSWPNLMESLMTMVHEESHGYDFEHSPSGKHLFIQRDDLIVTPPELPNMWPRSELVPMITDNATKNYDDVYLTGTQGTYDIIFLAEELNAYTNGCAAITAVVDQVSDQISARDGMVAHLYYLELYLKRGRTAHPAEYAALKADATWQKFVRFAWARGHFWDAQAKPFPVLDIASAPIWAHVNEAANLDEIKQFTGDDAATVACHP